MVNSIHEDFESGSINSVIQKILLAEVPLFINNIVLYSWGYHNGTNYLEPKSLYQSDINNYRTTILPELYFKDFKKFEISGELSKKSTKLFFLIPQHYFILQLHADEILDNIYKNLVITNWKPDDKMFPNRALHSGIGSWKF